jgi:hypothetical protein
VGFDPTKVSDTAPAVVRGVTIEKFLPIPAHGDPGEAVVAHHRREVAYDQYGRTVVGEA